MLFSLPLYQVRDGVRNVGIGVGLFALGAAVLAGFANRDQEGNEEEEEEEEEGHDNRVMRA